MDHKLSASSIQSDEERVEHARAGSRLANELAAVGAAFLDHMRTAGGIAAIPSTDPQQYVVAGTLAMIGQVLQQDAGHCRAVGEFEGYVDGEPLVRWFDRTRMPQVGEKLYVSGSAVSTIEQPKLTDDEITIIWQAMPGGPGGWLKSFGFLQFAREVEDAVIENRPAVRASAPVSIAGQAQAVDLKGLTRYMVEFESHAPEEAVLVADVERLLATQSVKQGAQTLAWLPIETAPKDGSEILLYLREPYSRVAMARWFDTWENWQEGEFPDVNHAEFSGIGSACPSHWTPIPVAPGIDQASVEQAPSTQEVTQQAAKAETSIDVRYEFEKWMSDHGESAIYIGDGLYSRGAVCDQAEAFAAGVALARGFREGRNAQPESSDFAPTTSPVSASGVLAEKLEAIAQSWDECICEGIGEDQEIGVVLREQFAKITTAQAATDKSEDTAPLVKCAAARDGDCSHKQCPQLRDNEPRASGRHCPIDTDKSED